VDLDLICMMAAPINAVRQCAIAFIKALGAMSRRGWRVSVWPLRWRMTTISFARHQFPRTIIRHTVWLYLRFTLSCRDVEDLLAERGLDVSYESVRRWVLKFGPLFARELRRSRHRPTSHAGVTTRLLRQGCLPIIGWREHKPGQMLRVK
jgi:hypothetical protein